MIKNLLLSLMLSGSGDVDQAIMLYEMGDIPGAISALEDLIDQGGLLLDEQLRAFDRLGSAYYAMGEIEKARETYISLLQIDIYYDLSPFANPRLREFLSQVRMENTATAWIHSLPDGALLAMDGELIGVTPMLVDGLFGGRSYDFKIYSTGYFSESYTLLAHAGNHHDINFTLLAAVISAETEVALADAGTQAGSSSVSTDMYVSTLSNPDIIEDISSGEVTTAEIVNILSSEDGGFDIASLASEGVLSSHRDASLQLAGSERIDPSDVTDVALASAMSSSEASGLIVFADAQSTLPSSVSASGEYSTRDPEEIMAVLAEKQASVTFIYNKHLRNDPLLSGTVIVEMIIQTSGRVSSTNILESNTYNPAFELELARAVETWRFGAVDEMEDPLSVVYPFNFSQSF